MKTTPTTTLTADEIFDEATAALSECVNEAALQAGGLSFYELEAAYERAADELRDKLDASADLGDLDKLAADAVDAALGRRPEPGFRFYAPQAGA